jgi:pimeloyl-ACP methyl ester carboxylesterase
MSPRGIRTALIALLLAGAAHPLHARQPVARILKQDSTLNNLVDPPGYRTAPPGTLGGVVHAGSGKRAMVLIPGLGFGGDVFAGLMDQFAAEYSMYAVTLPGFGGTAAPPSPPESTSFGAQTWTNNAIAAIEDLLLTEGLERPIIVGHWLTGTQIALRLALRNPGRIGAVVLLSGSARMTAADSARAARLATPESRIAVVDRFMAPGWFRTVTRETWDDNNFLPGDYAVNPVLGLRLWRRAAAAPLHVWVRYLCEFNAQDITPALDSLAVPALLLEPGLEGLEHDPGNNYMDAFCRLSWEVNGRTNPRLTVGVVPGARACMWYDRPGEVASRMRDFLEDLD